MHLDLSIQERKDVLLPWFGNQFTNSQRFRKLAAEIVCLIHAALRKGRKACACIRGFKKSSLDSH
jgi:hypothetical protein